ncbi:hypothetical protein AKJ16_DCAP00472 [Drosera capensis]
MGGFSQFLDFNQGSRARKQKKRQGFDTPRNSLDLPAAAFRSYYDVGRYAPLPQDETQDSSRRESCSTDASIKNMIEEETIDSAKRKQNAPNIVARLMGMDILPPDVRSVVQPLDKDEKIENNDVEEVQAKNEPAIPKKNAKPFKYRGVHSCQDYGEMHSDIWNKDANTKVSLPRVHPQEKELQQFKKEFEAWQAARFLKCARVIELGNIPEHWLAQLDLTKEKMALYENSRKGATENMNYHQNNFSISRSPNRSDSKYNVYKQEQQMHGHRRPPIAGRSTTARNKSTDSRFERCPMMESNRKPGHCKAPTRIVILKPGPDSFSSIDESWVSSSGSVEDRDSIDDLLDEVDERLKGDTPGETHNYGLTVRGSGIETPFMEKPSRSKLRAHCGAGQVMGNVNKKPGGDAVSSELTRWDTKEIEDNEPDSPGFARRDTRELLLDRLRNALYKETVQDTPNVSHSSPMLQKFDDVRGRLEEARDILSAQDGRNYWKDMNSQTEAQTRSFRYQLPEEMNTDKVLSPRNLVRCLSAPVSGASLAKLLLEDRHVIIEGQIRRKHESFEHVTADVKNRKKDGFTFLEKVSNIKFTLKEKLFARKIQPNHVTQSNDFDLANDRVNEQGAMTDYRDKHDNFTEVPPSPASIYNGASEELWKVAEHPSPLPKSDVTSVSDQSIDHIFRDISSNLTELQRQLNQLDHDGSEITTVTEEPSETDLVDWDDEATSYTRDLLIASGLYHGAVDKSVTRWDDSLASPISTRIFDQVEASKEETTVSSADHNDNSLQHRLLFDLLNEALSTIYRPYMASLSFTTKVTISSIMSPPKGRSLLEKAWNIIREHLYPSTDSDLSVEDIVAHNLCSMSWCSRLNEDLDVVITGYECLLISELVEEIVEDLL